MHPDRSDRGTMDKTGCHPLHTPVFSGDLLPGSRATVSLLSLRVLDPAPPLLQGPPQGGAAMPEMPAVLRDRAPAAPAAPAAAGAWTNTYCTTCLMTRRFLDRPTHLVCETCAKRLDKVSPARRMMS